MAIEALFCDFDGLLADTEHALFSAAGDLFQSYGAEVPLDKWLYQVGRAGPDDFWVPWLVEASTQRVDPTAAMNEFREATTMRIAQLGPKPGVIELLDAARHRGYRLAVVSSSPTTWVEPLLAQLGIRGAFETVVCREHAPQAKPAPDLYIEGARRLGVQCRASVAFEDSHNGSTAAVRADMTCIAVPGDLTRTQDFSHAHLVLDSLADADLDVIRALVVDRHTSPL